jgi:hypothetical protein
VIVMWKPEKDAVKGRRMIRVCHKGHWYQMPKKGLGIAGYTNDCGDKIGWINSQRASRILWGKEIFHLQQVGGKPQ